MIISKKDVNAVLSKLVDEGKIWAKCPECRIPLSSKEYKKLRCDACGKITLEGKEHITFHPKTNMC